MLDRRDLWLAGLLLTVGGCAPNPYLIDMGHQAGCREVFENAGLQRTEYSRARFRWANPSSSIGESLEAYTRLAETTSGPEYFVIAVPHDTYDWYLRRDLHATTNLAGMDELEVAQRIEPARTVESDGTPPTPVSERAGNYWRMRSAASKRARRELSLARDGATDDYIRNSYYWYDASGAKDQLRVAYIRRDDEAAGPAYFVIVVEHGYTTHLRRNLHSHKDLESITECR